MWRSKLNDPRGATLVEMIMVLLILSIITMIAVPQVQKRALREKEYQLRRDLISVRDAIDRFHADWMDGALMDGAAGVSPDGYPRNWDSLTEGVPTRDGKGPRRYLRQVPPNPFALDPEMPWRLLGLRDAPDATRWNKVDIFDLRANTDRIALDGTRIDEW
ncbi:type II secretion system GspH family protein (plasmid) [Aliiroseovarius crassostreae]|uniref:Type II secretion system GspH family protein n=1 Tax=Aliiroseovarius crassostreae TaxID=154981 RepID=A0A9Q9HBV4_9RHOB|nr:type II secretion system protein [Aliiroseovarius crassostreae]UWP97223.1 type II secretion system GspH family protein [Aliiroseovarius crassostreae]